MKVRGIEVKIIKGDLTGLKADAIVSPANPQLTMDRGLAELIKTKGGGAIEAEAVSKGPLPAGQAVATHAGHLKAKHIVHAVILGAGRTTDQTVLRRATAEALKRAGELGVSSVAFPALGCGQGGFPLVGAAKIMTQEVLKFSRDGGPGRAGLKEIIFCLHDQEAFEVFDKTVRGYVRHIQEDLGPGPYVTVDIIIEYGVSVPVMAGEASPGGIVLIERSNPPYGWALPGGFVDYGESLEEAAVREAKEETSLDLIDLRQFHAYSDPRRDPRFHTISTVFIAEGQGEPKAGDDAKGVKVARYADLPELEYAFDHKDIIREYLIEKDLDS
jgi:O-acetyl-ADP-ribose deacetylase (regulator of RNase III)/ADP-ribose pyrophosphatase YjhB (NUDIX family)